MSAFAQLKSIDDPRDRLDKAHRIELIRFAQQNGVAEIDPEMPAILMRDILRRKGLTNIQVPNRMLGQPARRDAAVVSGAQSNVPLTDAAADLAKQWQAQKQTVVEKPAKRVNEFVEIRSKLKKMRIPFRRNNTMQELKAKLAEHGKNASQRS